MKYDKTAFQEVLEPHHRTYWKIAYTKLQRKMQSLKSSLKKQSEDSKVIFDITIDQLREMFYHKYGKSCNTRKGPLDEKDFEELILWVETLKDETKEYVLRKLAKGGRY